MADDNDFAGQLEGWYNQIVKRAKLTTAQKAEINTAGAKAFEEVLREETPYNPNRKGVHMRDAITFVPGKNADNLPNGATDVGWDKDHAYIARIMNDGKKKMSPKEQAQLHFKDHAVEKARPLVLAAKAEAYRRIVNGGGNNDSGTTGAKIIKSLDLPIAHVYCFNWPPDTDLDDTSTTDVLITEVNDMPTTYGSDCSNEMEETVAINIFYASDSTVDFDKLEQPLLNAFEIQGWFCVYSPGHSIDPDTGQVTKVFQFKHLLRKDEI